MHISALRRDFERDRAGTQFTTQFTSFTSTKVQIQTLEELLRAAGLPRLALLARKLLAPCFNRAFAHPLQRSRVRSLGYFLY